MSSGVTPYASPIPIRSSLFRSPPDAIPPVDELEALQNELKLLKQRTLERAKKAGDDLKTIEESMRRLKEKEKGKGKAIDKVKKERGCTCIDAVILTVSLTSFCVIVFHSFIRNNNAVATSLAIGQITQRRVSYTTGFCTLRTAFIPASFFSAAWIHFNTMGFVNCSNASSKW